MLMTSGERTIPREEVRSAPRRATALWLTAALTSLIALPIFAYLGAVKATAHGPHNQFTIDLVAHGKWQPHFLLHLTVALLGLGATDYTQVSRVAAVVLALAIGARTALSFAVIDRDGRHPIRTSAFCLALLLAMPLFNWWKFPAVYLGQITPNIWSNPTLVFAMPFGLALFLLGDRYFRAPTLANLALVGVLMPLGALAKPNYLLAYGPCFGLVLGVRVLAAIRRREMSVGRALLTMLVGLGPAAAVLGAQFVLTFTDASASRVRVIVAPWKVWSLYSPNIPVSILLGIAFPLVYCLLNRRIAWQDRRLHFAWLVLAVAIVQFAVLAESGDHLTAANFAWGSYLADYVLFVLCCAHLVRQRSAGVRFWIPWCVLFLHAGCGAFYVARFLGNTQTGWL